MQTLLDDYKNVQYDLLFGKQYLAEHIDHDYLTKAIQDSYIAEFDDPNTPLGSAAESSNTPSAKPVSAQ